MRIHSENAQRTITIAAALLLSLGSVSAFAQDSPLISGAFGFASTTNGGQTVLQPVVAPVLDLPLGDKFLIESRADIRGFYSQENGNGSYRGQFFTSLAYAQVDYLVNSRLTFTAGRFLTPFNVYNERLTAIWIANLPEVPLIFSIGTRTSGSSNGAMVRGVAANNSSFQLNYAAFVSGGSNLDQLQAGRALGGRVGVFLPGSQLEVGGSYERLLENQHSNAEGAYAWWVPVSIPVQIRSEFANSPQGHGYWVESAFRFTRQNSLTSVASRIQPVFRMQQTFRGELDFQALLFPEEAKEADFGLNIYLPQEIRLSSSYGRQVSAGADRNIWDVSLTYRFIWPLTGGTK